MSVVISLSEAISGVADVVDPLALGTAGWAGLGTKLTIPGRGVVELGRAIVDQALPVVGVHADAGVGLAGTGCCPGRAGNAGKLSLDGRRPGSAGKSSFVGAGCGVDGVGDGRGGSGG